MSSAVIINTGDSPEMIATLTKVTLWRDCSQQRNSRMWSQAGGLRWPEDSGRSVPRFQGMTSDAILHHSLLPWNKFTFILWTKRVEFPSPSQSINDFKVCLTDYWLTMISELRRTSKTTEQCLENIYKEPLDYVASLQQSAFLLLKVTAMFLRY